MLGITGPLRPSGSVQLAGVVGYRDAVGSEFHQLSTNLVALPALCRPSLPEVMDQNSIPCSMDANYKLPAPENPFQAGKGALGIVFLLCFSMDKRASREELLAIDLSDKNAYRRKMLFQ